MAFIEQILGLSPDNGTGSLELLILLVPIAALAMRIRRGSWMRSRRRR